MRRAVSAGALAVAVTLALAPATVQADAATRKPARVACNGQRSIYGSIPRRAPVRCQVLPAGASLSEGAKLDRLHWRGWGRATAAARGVLRPFHRGAAAVPVRVVAYRLRRDQCGTNGWFYTRLRSTTRFGGGVLRLPACSARIIRLSNAEARGLAFDRLEQAAREASEFAGTDGAPAINGLRCELGVDAVFSCSARVYVRIDGDPVPCRNPATVIVRGPRSVAFVDHKNPCMIDDDGQRPGGPEAGPPAP